MDHQNNPPKLPGRLREQICQSFDNEANRWGNLGTDSLLAGRLPLLLREKPIIVVTWNIDFQAPNGASRMAAALQHLSSIISDQPTVILLQEMDREDLDVIKASKWVQSRFSVTDIQPNNWRSHYGTTSLIDHCIPIAKVFRVDFVSRMGRDALFVDILLDSLPAPQVPADPALEDDSPPHLLRVCNTHLESLVADPPRRPAQVKLVSQHLQDREVYAGVMAGDFNAIQDFDRTLHIENDLKDAYLEAGGKEDDEAGHTWGMQSPSNMGRYPDRRMDKVLYCGNSVAIKSFKKIGEGVTIPIKEMPEGQFVSDHLGLMVEFALNSSAKESEEKTTK